MMKRNKIQEVSKTKKEMTPEKKAFIGQIAAVAISSLIGGAFMAVGSRGANCLMDKAASKKTK